MENKKVMNIYEKLANIQNEMKVPKNLYNKFGNYYYRNAETILDSAKPICSKYGLTLVVYDEIEEIQGRFYVKAVAQLFDWDSDSTIKNQAFAREEETKKGMDGSQLTGSSSSYARKYALNGLFNLDDVKDADTPELKKQQDKVVITIDKAKSAKLINEIKKYNEANKPTFMTTLQETLSNMKEKYGTAKFSELPTDELEIIVKLLKSTYETVAEVVIETDELPESLNINEQKDFF